MAEKKDAWHDLALKRLNESLDWWGPEWDRAVSNYAFYKGEHRTPEEVARLEAAERAAVSWNDILTIVNAATGREIMSRFQPSFRGRVKRLRQLPIEQLQQTLFQQLSPELQEQLREELEDDSAAAQALTELLRWIRQGTDADTEDSQTFLDTFICGWGCQEIRMDWLDNPDGKIVHDNLYPWEVAPDRFSKKRNFADGNYVFRFREVTEEDMRSVFGDKAADRLREAGSRDSATMENRPIEAMTSVYKFKSTDGFYDLKRNTYIVTEYEYRERLKDLIEFDDPREGGAPQRIEGEDAFKEWQAETGIDSSQLALTRRPRYVYKRAILAGSEILREPTVSPVQAFSFVFMTCFPDRKKDGTKWFGLVDVGKDPQRWKDKFMSSMIDMIARSPKAPIHAEENSFKDLDEARQTVARDDGIVIYERNAIVQGRVKFGAGPTYPRGFEPLFMFAKDGIRDAMGLSQVATGQLSDPRRAPFATVNALQQATQMNLAQPFDSLRISRKTSAHVDMLYAGEYLPANTIRSVVGYEHFAALPKPKGDGEVFGSSLKELKRYDLVTDESPSSPTAMQEILNHLTQTQLFAVLQQAGAAPPPGVLIDMFVELGLPAQMGEQWKLSMMQAGQDPNQAGGDMVQMALQQILPALSPGVREAVMAELQQGQAAEGQTPTVQ